MAYLLGIRAAADYISPTAINVLSVQNQTIDQNIRVKGSPKLQADMKQILRYKIRFFISILLFCSGILASAQTLKKPEAAPNQSPPPGSSPWVQACASGSFNDYWVNFTWSPPLVNSSNEFILELSDANGDFTNPVELARDGSKNTVFDFFFQFQVPPDTRGENYRFRVRSTSPALTSPPSDPHPMYYLSVNSGIKIRQQGEDDFGNGSAQICDGNSITLEVYDLANAGNYQYNWYRSGTLLAEKSDRITVTTAGMYNAEIDYGACSGSGNTLSNIMDITVGSSLGIAINPPAKTDLCEGEMQALEANISGSGLTYTWYKDGTPVTSPTIDDHIYTVDATVTNFEGDYQVEVYGPGACVERSSPVSITNAGNVTASRDNEPELVILPGNSVTLNVSTNASNPSYQWYRNGTVISGATTNSYTINDVADEGDYYAEVTQTGGACASATATSEITTVIAPVSFEIVTDHIGNYTACENTSTALEVTRINALDDSGNKTDVTSSLRDSFTYQWYKDGVAISGETAATISLTDTSENGSYTLEGNIDTYSSTSSALDVQLLVNETLLIESTGLVSCGDGEIITISTDTDLDGQTFSWTRDNEVISSSDQSLNTTEPGIYQLVLQRNGCPLPSNEIVISPIDESLITLDQPGAIVFPEGSSKTVTASGGDSYQWYDSSNTERSNTSSMTFTEEGSYLLVASIGNCTITRSLKVEYLDTFKVPNVISVNGDGINDQWVIPNSYSNKEDVTVIIYNERGEEIFNQPDYKNNWPESTRVFPKQNMVFYYKIKNANSVLKQGTITIIR